MGEGNGDIQSNKKGAGLIVGLFRWGKINEVYSEQNKLVLGGDL